MALNSLMSRMLKVTGKKSRAAALSQSNFITKDIIFSSRVPIINLMLGGAIDGGVAPGVHQVVGESRTFKTNFCLSLVRDFLDAHKEGVCLFFDTEFGAAKYFDAFGIDKDRVIHIPCENLEEMKFQMVQMIEDIGEDDKVMIFVDSVSQVASKKEMENALEENSAADLTRAREMNSFFRIITPKLQIRKIPLFAVNSFYDSISNKYAEPTIKGGKQIFLSSDVILFVTRSQVKDDKDEKKLAGWSFNYSAMKSRYVKEKSKFSVVVTYAGGIDNYTGMFELAQEAGYLRSEKQGWYNIHLGSFSAEKSWRRKDLENYEPFFEELCQNKDFKEYCFKKYSLDAGEFFEGDEDAVEIDNDTGEVIKG
jgi:RecA/RadA recombinase